MMVASVLMTTALAAVPSAASADSGKVSASEAATALRTTSTSSRNLVAEPAQSSADVDSAAVATSDNVKVDVPKDLSNGVGVTANGQEMSISLPNAGDAGKATRLPDGTVAYAGTNGSANAVVPTDGGVQMITTIKNASAPSRYTYKVSVPDGGKVSVVQDGRAIVTDARGTVIMAVDVPWAKDANGVSVPTHYETNGVALTQVVDHAGGNYAYPITADPRWISRTWYGAMVVHYTRAETYDLAHGATLGSVLGFRWTPVGVAFGLAAWWVQGVYDRGQCLVAHVWPGSPWATWFWSERC
jgi:hypothetical protein